MPDYSCLSCSAVMRLSMLVGAFHHKVLQHVPLCACRPSSFGLGLLSTSPALYAPLSDDVGRAIRHLGAWDKWNRFFRCKQLVIVGP